jgi:hypothetical protein
VLSTLSFKVVYDGVICTKTEHNVEDANVAAVTAKLMQQLAETLWREGSELTYVTSAVIQSFGKGRGVAEVDKMPEFTAAFKALDSRESK